MYVRINGDFPVYFPTKRTRLCGTVIYSFFDLSVVNVYETNELNEIPTTILIRIAKLFLNFIKRP